MTTRKDRLNADTVSASPTPYAHSPGPWEIRRLPEWDGTTAGVIIQANQTTYRGAICFFQSCAHIGDINSEELLANAKLIVASQDMLRALLRLVACPDAAADMLSPETIAALDQARDVIADATRAA